MINYCFLTTNHWLLLFVLEPNTITATYVDNTDIFSSGNDPVQTSSHLQNHINLIENWSSKWRIKIYSCKFHIKKIQKSYTIFTRNTYSYLFSFQLHESFYANNFLETQKIYIYNYIKLFATMFSKHATLNKYAL